MKSMLRSYDCLAEFRVIPLLMSYLWKSAHNINIALKVAGAARGLGDVYSLSSPDVIFFFCM